LSTYFRLQKKNRFAGIDAYSERQANDYEKWGNTTDKTREKDTEMTNGRLKWKYRGGNEIVNSRSVDESE
jgi:hypothetical protein